MALTCHVGRDMHVKIVLRQLRPKIEREAKEKQKKKEKDPSKRFQGCMYHICIRLTSCCSQSVSGSPGQTLLGPGSTKYSNITCDGIGGFADHNLVRGSWRV